MERGERVVAWEESMEGRVMSYLRWAGTRGGWLIIHSKRPGGSQAFNKSRRQDYRFGSGAQQEQSIGRYDSAAQASPCWPSTNPGRPLSANEV